MVAKKKKRNIDIIIQIDSREQKTDYVRTIKIDSRRNKDGVKIIGTETVCVKPKGCKGISTGDVSYKWKYEDENEWTQSNLSIEIKRSTDLFGSIYVKKNRERLFLEIDRAKNGKLDFWFLITNNITEMNRKIEKIPKMFESACMTHFTNFIRLNKYLSDSGFRESICTGNNIGWVIRRLVKQNAKKIKR